MSAKYGISGRKGGGLPPPPAGGGLGWGPYI